MAGFKDARYSTGMFASFCLNDNLVPFEGEYYSGFEIDPYAAL